MTMLTTYQIELINREIDGENTPEASAEVRELVTSQAEALALLTNLQSLDALFREVPYREPAPSVRQAIDKAMSTNPRVSPRNVQGTTQTITGWAVQQWNGISTFMGELMLTKKVLLVATTAVAAIAIIGNALVGYPPSIFDAGTIGGGDGMSGVQQAGRYKGKTEADVTLSNPEIQTLLQNDQVLRLVKSDAFRAVMRDDASRKILSSDAFRMALSSDASRKALSSDAFRIVMSNDASRKIFSSDAFRMVNARASYQELMATAAYQDLMATAAYQDLMASESFRQVLANDSFRMMLANESFRALLANEQFRAMFANEQFRAMFANEQFRMVLASDSFRAIAREQSLSEAFLSEAMRVAP